MNRFHHVRIKLESFLNNLSLKKKLRYLYFLCILIPIFLTDIVILHALTKNEHAEQLHQMEKNSQISAVDAFRRHRRFRADFYQPVYG